MLIAHVSDFHIFSSVKETPFVREDATAAARKVVADIAAHSSRVHAVMLTGDLTDGGSPEDYALLKDVLLPLKVPIFVVPGNHDKRDAMMAAFPTLPYSSDGFAQFEAYFEGIRILGLDTLEEGRPEGNLCDRRLEWLETRLTQSFDGLTLILMHHAPFPSGMTALDRMSLVGGRDRFCSLIADYQAPLNILSGHIHRPYQSLWKGAFCAVAGSPAFQVAFEFAGQSEPPPSAQPYAWYLHVIDSGETSIHAQYVSL